MADDRASGGSEVTTERTVEVYGRTIDLAVSSEPDEFGQFRVSVSVDGKERWSARFIDKTDYEFEQALEKALNGFQDEHGRWPGVDEQTAIRERISVDLGADSRG